MNTPRIFNDRCGKIYEEVSAQEWDYLCEATREILKIGGEIIFAKLVGNKYGY
jgi:hypothetical protein